METADEVVDAAQAAPAIATQVAEYNPIAAALGQLSQQLRDRAYDLRTVKGNDEARADRRRLVSLRTGLEKLRLDLNRADRETIEARIALRNTEAERIEGLIREFETPIDEQIKADEARREQERLAKLQAEADRVAAIRARIDQIGGVALRAVGQSAADIEQKIRLVVAIALAPADFAEFAAEAEIVKADTLVKLRDLHGAAIAAEAEAARVAAERAELQRLREAQAQREREEQLRREAEAEQRRREQEAEAARIAAEREKLEEQRRAQQAEQQRLDDEAAERRRVADAAAAAERERADREARERREQEEARLAEQRAELQRQQDEQDRIAREAREAEEKQRAKAQRKADELAARLAEEQRVRLERETAARTRLQEAAQQMLDALLLVRDSQAFSAMDTEPRDAVVAAIAAATEA